MPNKSELKSISLRKLRISNFKGLDSFEIEFPHPRMKNDPDIFVLGSKNGLGKTSVLEATALLTLYLIIGDQNLIFESFHDSPINLSELFIRAGKKETSIEGLFDFSGEDISIRLDIGKNGFIATSSKIAKVQKHCKQLFKYRPELVESFLLSLAGINTEPLLVPFLLYFHSYRKVQEGNPELGMIAGNGSFSRRRFRSGSEYPISTFKLEILRSMMDQANLFETPDNEESHAVLKKLNGLIERYAGGRVGKLRPSPDNTIDFRIIPTKGGESFTFDGLSSGQKEIISTLFLIWHYSRSYNGIVLIDEPELHLNPEWHRDFVKQVTDLVPGNQYIVATHSEDIFASVPEDRRALLVGK